MRHKRPLTTLLPPTILTLLLVAVSAMAVQDPTGRPEGAGPKRKKPVVAPKPKAPVEPPTVILTILSEPASDVFLNGEKRGTTDGDGKLIINKLLLGSYSIEVRKDGFMPAYQGFRAGVESPTLKFVLNPALDPIVKQVGELLEAGKLLGPETPHAMGLYRDSAAKFPDRPEVLKMRTMLADRLKARVEPLLARTLHNWRGVTRDELTQACDESAALSEVTPGDKYSEAEAIYFKAVTAFRDWQSGSRTAAAAGGATDKPSGSAGEEHPNGLASVRAELGKTVTLVDSWAPGWYQLGVVLLLLGETGPAEAAFVRTTALEPRWAIGHAGLGEAYYAGKKYKEAMASFQKANELETKPRSVAGLALARFAKGETAQGLKDVQQAAAMDATSGLPHYYLGIMYAASKKDKERAKAEGELKKAIELNAQNLEFQNRAAEQLLTEIQSKKKRK
jgi:tetratricopeptide (TPR) repeat protein